MRLAFLFCFCCSAVLGQTFSRTTAYRGAAAGTVTNAPAGGGSFPSMNPTNGMGAYAAFWYESSLGYTTNGGVATLPNLTTNGHAWDLTNADAATSPVLQASAKNGLAALCFNAGPYLMNTAVTSPPPMEVIIYAVMTNTLSGGNQMVFDSAEWDTNRLGFAISSSGFPLIRDYVGSLATGNTDVTEKYTIFDLVFEWYSAPYLYGNIFTNGVKELDGLDLRATTNSLGGLTLGASYTKAGVYSANSRILTIFGFTNQILGTYDQAWTTVRSNAFWYCTNRFGAPQ